MSLDYMYKAVVYTIVQKVLARLNAFEIVYSDLFPIFDLR